MPFGPSARNRPTRPSTHFFVAGADLLKIAEISRVHRDGEGSLQGFQRKGIKSHVQAITEFLDRGPVLFPNAIILAISPRARFTQTRGEKPDGDVRSCQAGDVADPVAERRVKGCLDRRWSATFDRAVSGAGQELSSSCSCIRFGGTVLFTASNSFW